MSLSEAELSEVERAYERHVLETGRFVSPGNVKHSQELQAAEKTGFDAGWDACVAQQEKRKEVALYEESRLRHLLLEDPNTGLHAVERTYARMCLDNIRAAFDRGAVEQEAKP